MYEKWKLWKVFNIIMLLVKGEDLRGLEVSGEVELSGDVKGEWIQTFIWSESS